MSSATYVIADRYMQFYLRKIRTGKQKHAHAA